MSGPFPSCLALLVLLLVVAFVVVLRRCSPCPLSVDVAVAVLPSPFIAVVTYLIQWACLPLSSQRTPTFGWFQPLQRGICSAFSIMPPRVPLLQCCVFLLTTAVGIQEASSSPEGFVFVLTR